MNSNFSYTIHESPKAKNVRLKISVKNGLIIVIPKDFDKSRIPKIIDNKKQWILRTTSRLEKNKKFFSPEPSGHPPEKILLRAIGEEWSVEYRPSNAQWVAAVERKGNQLLVYGDIDNLYACKQAIKRWLIRKTHETLSPMLQYLAHEKGFKIKDIFVKSQKTRWASCSRQKNISINLKMLFLPTDLIRYIFIHELCHTVYMSHSREYWGIVQRNAHDYAEKNDKLKQAWQYIPAWFESRSLKLQ